MILRSPSAGRNAAAPLFARASDGQLSDSGREDSIRL
jgi:hypothetical protein